MSTSSGSSSPATAATTRWASVTQLRRYLDQVPVGAANDALLADVLERATDIVAKVLEFRFEGYTTSTKLIRARYGPYLPLPPHEAGSVSLVALNGSTISTGYWTELDSGTLCAVDALGGTMGDWYSYRYSVTAAWGYGDPPASIVEVVLEVAVNIWRSKAASKFTNVVGVDGGGAVGYEGALTPQQKLVIEKVRQQYRGGPVV